MLGPALSSGHMTHSTLGDQSWLKQRQLCWTVVVGEGNGTPLQYSCLENPMDGGAWKAEVHGVARSRTRLSDFTFTFRFHALEKEMATHCSILALDIPWTEEPAGYNPRGGKESDMTEQLNHCCCCFC